MDEVSGLPLYRGVDLALLLPAVALNLRPGEDVLDMNAGAADGTHTLALAQTLMPRRIVCAEGDRLSLEQVRIARSSQSHLYGSAKAMMILDPLPLLSAFHATCISTYCSQTPSPPQGGRY